MNPFPMGTGVRVWLATGYTDMRCGFPSLALRVQEVLKHDPFGGHLFCFRGKRGDMIKIVWHDGLGACLFTRRLEKGRFIWPAVEGGAVSITPAQLSYLLSGIDWRNPQETWRPTRIG
ncbi:MAG: IS66 family insertion sequence element accessory protein TnpB [Pseudoxanthomonas sp.]